MSADQDGQYVLGIKPPDERWQQMKTIWDSYMAAKLPVPDEIWNFFNGEEPDSMGVIVDLRDHDCATRFQAEMKSGLVIDLSKVPDGVQYLRFYQDWD